MPDRMILLAVTLLALALFLAAPALIALVRRHPERRTIYRLSGLSIFSFLLWFALIVWAASDRRDDAVISRYVARLRRTNMLPVIVTVLVLVGLAGSAFTLLR